MKRSLSWIIASLLLVLAVSCFTLSAYAQKTLSDEEAYKRFVGTWQNPEAQGKQVYTKFLVPANYQMKAWIRMDSPSAKEFTAEIKKTWVDAEGRTYCQFFYTYTKGYSGRHLALMRLDKSRKVLEWNAKMQGEGSTFPDQIESKVPGNWTVYCIFYRK